MAHESMRFTCGLEKTAIRMPIIQNESKLRRYIWKSQHRYFAWWTEIQVVCNAAKEIEQALTSSPLGTHKCTIGQMDHWNGKSLKPFVSGNRNKLQRMKNRPITTYAQAILLRWTHGNTQQLDRIIAQYLKWCRGVIHRFFECVNNQQWERNSP